ncbi:sporulation protein, partial [Actinomadura kijaniata]|uniref:sporulation protein n=1 Tax=Actinomadura kijaniata TaxID=46161 RepID=UPI00083209A8
MVFKRVLGTFGVGGPAVDTVLATPFCAPGGSLSGEVRITAADYGVELQRVTLSLVTGVESGRGTELHRTGAAGAFRLRGGERRVIPFRLAVPWGTPLTEVHGQPLFGVGVGVRTELAVARAVDKDDLAMVTVRPTASQERVLAALAELGFQLRGVEAGAGRPPLRQGIGFYPPGAYHGRIGEVELTIAAEPGGLAVALEAEGVAPARFQVGHEDALRMDWATEISAWLETAAEHPGAYAAYGHGVPRDGRHEERRGPGWGGVAAGAAAGVAAG